MKSVHIIPHINDESKGPSYSVSALCKNISNLGNDSELVYLEPGVELKGVRTKRFNPIKLFKSWGVSPSLYEYLKTVAQQGVIFHNHSLWLMPNIYPGFVKKRYPYCKIVVSPRGTLSEYALSISRIKKSFVLPIQRFTLSQADCFHATSHKEYKEIRAKGYKQPIAVIPNGIDLPKLIIPKKDKRKRLIYLGRIHPIKGLDNLIKAWSRIEKNHNEWDLHIIGPDNNNYAKDLKKLVEVSKSTRIHFEGEVHGSAKINWYQNANLFVLPSHSENFGVAVTEALANGTPVIVSDQTPWHDVNRKGCGWCVSNNEESLKNSLEVALNANNLEEMGILGRKWMEDEFSWNRISEDMISLYSWISGETQKPSCVFID